MLNKLKEKIGAEESALHLKKKLNPFYPRPYLLNHKAQEEIMGFMLIVVMVIVIGLAFMFLLTPRPIERNDLDIENLIYSWKTADINDSSVEGMIKDCEDGSCADLQEAEKIVGKAIETKWPGSINGYTLNITGCACELPSYSKGNLTGSWKSASVFVSESNVNLKIYYP